MSEIAGMRDRAARQYLNDGLVKQWNTVWKDIPALRDRCLKIKQDLESEQEDE